MNEISMRTLNVAILGCVVVVICAIAPMNASGSELTDDFTGGLGNWTSTMINDVNNHAPNTSTWRVNGSDQLELNTTAYSGIEQFAFIRSGATLDIGEEARVTMAIPISGNRNLGLYVGGTAPMFDVREDFINVYGETSATIAARGYDGTTDYGNTTRAGVGADTLFIARTAENTFEVGFYAAGVRTVFETHTPTTPNSADYVGIYADVRSAGTVRAIDSFQITSDPIEPPEPPVVPQPSNKKVYVILLGGQSNTVGFGYHQYLLDENHPLANPQMDVEMYAGCGLASVVNQLLPLQSGAGNDFIMEGVMQYPDLTTGPISRFGPELSMARTVRDGIDILDSKVVIIKYAVNGTALVNKWYGDGTDDSSSDGPVYQAFQTTMYAGLAAIQKKYPYHEVEIIGMGWVQGESDRDYASGYEARLTTFIADVRATFATNMVFVLSRLSSNQDDNYAGWPTIRAAQAAVAAADPLVVATDTEGTNYPCSEGYAELKIHFLSSALVQIGEDLGQALLATLELDADGDQLPDDWENDFIPPGAAELGNTPAADFDGDGITDRNEFRIGTSPVDPEDGLSLSITNATSIQWPAKRGIGYNIQHSTNLISWSLLDTVLLDTNKVAVVPISGIVSNRVDFFSLEVQM